MRARDLLADLRRRGVALDADGDRISVDAPAGVIDGRLRELLAENKQAIIKLLEWERRRLREADRRVARGEGCGVPAGRRRGRKRTAA